jgi:hypothetical protein
MRTPPEVDRQTFLDEYWEYDPGMHVLTVAPTGAGKSYLNWQLLEKAMEQHPSLRVVTYMPKPRDPQTVTDAKRLNLKETATWPPRRPGWFDEKPKGYVLWPNHPHGPGVDTMERREAVGKELRKGLEDQYWKGNSVSFIDDAHSAATMMNLNPLIEETLVNGRAGGSGMWLATQKPSGTRVSGGITSYAYSSASKMFFSKDNDEANLTRLSEIGAGFDPKEVASWVQGLHTWRINGSTVGEFLYLDRAGYAMKIQPW